MGAFMSGRLRASIFTFFLFLSACTIQLAPAFDQRIVDDLQAASEAALVQYATVSGGSDKSKFPEMEDDYNQLIGKLDAVRLMSQSRYFPASPTRGLFRRFDPVANIKKSEDYEAPSVRSLTGMVTTLTALRDKHHDAGLTRGYVATSKNQFETYLDQAMTYERALER